MAYSLALRTSFLNATEWQATKQPQDSETLLSMESRHVTFEDSKISVSAPKQNLAQLYRFCFLMLGDSDKAQEVFQTTLREAARRAANEGLPNERFWLFRDARWRCLEASETDLQAEPLEIEEQEITAGTASQIGRLEPIQLAIWISAAPEPQRTALAFFYLDEFDYREIADLAELKLSELSRLLAGGRRQFQAWLDATFPERPTV